MPPSRAGIRPVLLCTLAGIVAAGAAIGRVPVGLPAGWWRSPRSSVAALVARGRAS